MNQAIANIIKTKIEGLDFVDKIAGLTSVTYFDIKDKDNNLVQKAFPIACCVSADDCKEGSYNELMPDSKYKTVIYFEDMGVTFNRSESHWKYYTSNLRLVCWINVAKILGDDCNEGTACTLSSHLITEIIRVLPEFADHYYPFNHVYSEVINQEIRSNSIFAAYTYDEKHAQYLMYPYDYFALDIQTQFAICLRSETVYDSSCDATGSLDAPVATAATDIGLGSFVANWQSVDGADGYVLEVDTVNTFDSPSSGIVSGTSNLVYCAAGTTFYYRVKAYNATNESAWSNIITLTSLGLDPPVATDATLITGDSFRANWGAVTGAGGYYVDVATDAGFTAMVETGHDAGNNLFAVFSGLTGSTDYYYRVRAYLGTSQSVNSNTITLETLIIDYDGNVYTSVIIGTQEWTVENLKTTHYNDGSDINLIILDAGWNADVAGAMCFYDNDEATYKSTYGALYNWYAVNTGKLAPSGWRVPTYNDWSALQTFIGGLTEGGKLKEIGTTHWAAPNTGALDTYGFKSIGSGVRYYTGAFAEINERNWLWSSLQYDATRAYITYLIYNDGTMGDISAFVGKNYGITVRLVRDV